MKKALQELVRRRAGDCCEYCRLPQSGSGVAFEIDHILSRKHGGSTTADNLALSCAYCNGFKGTDMTGKDPLTGAIERLFNPRDDRWLDHFRWHGVEIVGLSAIGRATVQTLKTNSPAALALRAALLDEGVMRMDL